MKQFSRRFARTGFAAVAFVFLSLSPLALIISSASAQEVDDSPPAMSLEEWKAHGVYEITEEQRTVERDGEERTVTDHILTVPELDMEFVWIEALGAWVGRFEVTNAQYRLFEPEFRSRAAYISQDYDFDTPDRPAIVFNVERRDHRPPDRSAVFPFIDWLNEREHEAGRLPEGHRFNLPTGEQWTVFARCGDSRRFPWGDTWPPAYGNYADESAREHLARFVGDTIRRYDDGHPHTAPVKESGRNDWGLYGVGGNMAEWTLEREGGLYAARGGSWAHSTPLMLTVDFRIWVDEPSWVNIAYLGFRLVLSR